jgi:hypothetical protein
MPHARLLLPISFNFKHAHPSTLERAEFHGDIASKGPLQASGAIPSGRSLSHGVERLESVDV